MRFLLTPSDTDYGYGTIGCCDGAHCKAVTPDKSICVPVTDAAQGNETTSGANDNGPGRAHGCAHKGMQCGGGGECANDDDMSQHDCQYALRVQCLQTC